MLEIFENGTIVQTFFEQQYFLLIAPRGAGRWFPVSLGNLVTEDLALRIFDNTVEQYKKQDSPDVSRIQLRDALSEVIKDYRPL